MRREQRDALLVRLEFPELSLRDLVLRERVRGEPVPPEVEVPVLVASPARAFVPLPRVRIGLRELEALEVLEQHLVRHLETPWLARFLLLSLLGLLRVLGVPEQSVERARVPAVLQQLDAETAAALHADLAPDLRQPLLERLVLLEPGPPLHLRDVLLHALDAREPLRAAALRAPVVPPAQRLETRAVEAPLDALQSPLLRDALLLRAQLHVLLLLHFVLLHFLLLLHFFFLIVILLDVFQLLCSDVCLRRLCRLRFERARGVTGRAEEVEEVLRLVVGLHGRVVFR